MKGDLKAEISREAQAIHMYSLQLEALARTLTHVHTADDAGQSSLKAQDLVHIMNIFQCDLDAIRDHAQGIIFSMEKEIQPARIGAE
jgi:hypothetical protein